MLIQQTASLSMRIPLPMQPGRLQTVLGWPHAPAGVRR